MLNPARLYPTARLQIVRDLFFREWQARAHRSHPRPTGAAAAASAADVKSTSGMRRTPRPSPNAVRPAFPTRHHSVAPPLQSRSRRLGRELYPLYFPDEPEEARAAMAVRAKTLSDYEEERNRQARVSITVPTHSPTRGKPRRPPEHSAPRSFALTIRKHTSHRRHHPCRPSHYPRVRLHRPRALPRCRHGHIPHRPLSAAASRSP